MDEIQKGRLQQNRVNIVNDLEPRGKVLDSLFEDGVLTENDLELVSSAQTRKARCQLLLSILPTRGPSAYGSFQKALSIGRYDFLFNELNTQNDENTVRHDTSGARKTGCGINCDPCHAFLSKYVSQGETVLNIGLLTVLNSHCCLLIDNIEPRDLIDQLFQDRVISADDIDKIMTNATRRDRCETLIRILLTNPNDRVVEKFEVSLSKKYSYIVEKLSSAGDETCIKGTVNEETASKCCEGESSYNNQTEYQPHRRGHTRSDPGFDTLQTQPKIIPGVQKVDVRIRPNDYVDKEGKDIEDSVDIKALSDVGLACTRARIGDMNSVDGATLLEQTSKNLSESKLINIENVKTVTETSTTQDKTLSNRCFKSECIGYQSHAPKRMRKKQNRERGSATGCLRSRTTKSEEKENISNNNDNQSRSSDLNVIVSKQVTAVQSEKPRKRLIFAFNYLSTLINQGDFLKFEELSMKLRNQFPYNYDLLCIIGYLQTSRDLFQTDFDSAKGHIDSTMALVPKTSNPRYFALEIFTAKTRMYITQKKLEKLQTTLDEAMMILETDPVGCTGRAAGWLYINDARNKTAQLSCLNLSHPNALKVYERLFENARSSFQRSMTNFKRDGGKDGPFGFGYALCRLVILLLRCGDNGLTMATCVPRADDIKSANQYLQHLEDSDIVMAKILDMHFRLAKCDYQFRRGNFIRALEHAHIAHDLATEMRLLEFTEHAHNRVAFLEPKVSTFLAADKVTDEEAERILFDESTDTDGGKKR